MITTVDFAPLDGITKAVFRVTWARHFGGVDRFFIPFFSPTPQHIMTPRDLREVAPANNGGLCAIPQIMTRRADDFIWAAQTVADLGYEEVNLNLGCPSGTVTAKGKGSGFLAYPDELDAFFEEVFSKLTVKVSVKTRLGINDPAEFPRLMEIYNRYPITMLTIHPRVRAEKYRGRVHMDVFREAFESAKIPICFNGDLQTVEDVRAVEEAFPTLTHVMLGRGPIADPALPRKLRGGSSVTVEELEDFLEDLYQGYQEFYGQVEPACQRMKEVWFYLYHLFEDGERLSGKLRRSRSPADYERIQGEFLHNLKLRDHADGAYV